MELEYLYNNIVISLSLISIQRICTFIPYKQSCHDLTQLNITQFYFLICSINVWLADSKQ